MIYKIGFLLFTAMVSSQVLAAPETYAIDNSHTYPRFSYSHFGFSTQLSRFDKTTGTITLDKESKTGSINVTIDTSSVATGSALFNEHIQGADFLDTAHYPSANFTSTKVNYDGDKIVSVDGNITLKGITKPITLTVNNSKCAVHPILQKDTCGADVSTQLKRSDFNMGKYAPNVGDEMTLLLAVEVVKP